MICIISSCSYNTPSKERSNQPQNNTASVQVFAPPVPPATHTMRVEGLLGSRANGVPSWFTMLQNGNGQSSYGSMECLFILPDQYKNAVVDMSSDNGSPDPQTWYATVLPPQGDWLRYLEINNGKIVTNSGFSIFANIFWSHKPMSLPPSMIDSRRVYEIAKQYASESGYTLAYASYLLSKNGKSGEATWSANCYGPNDSYLGQIKLLAKDGSVTSVSGFR